MAFGVVVAGTGALSGTGGQKRYRVNRFRREIYRFGWALGGTRDRNHRDIDYSIRLFSPSMYAPYIYRIVSRTRVFIVVHSCRPFVSLPFFFPDLQSRIVVFFRRDNRFAALLECTRIYLGPLLRESNAGEKFVSPLSSVCRVSGNDVSRA